MCTPPCVCACVRGSTHARVCRGVRGCKRGCLRNNGPPARNGGGGAPRETRAASIPSSNGGQSAGPRAAVPGLRPRPSRNTMTLGRPGTFQDVSGRIRFGLLSRESRQVFTHARRIPTSQVFPDELIACTCWRLIALFINKSTLQTRALVCVFPPLVGRTPSFNYPPTQGD